MKGIWLNMKIYGLTDNLDISVGMRLAGMHVEVLNENDDANKIIEEISNNKDVGILVISKNINNLAQTTIENIKQNKKTPLIVTI